MGRWQMLSLAVLYLMVIGMALLTINNRHESRQRFVQLQVLEKERDRLSADWSRLKLEQSAQLHQMRIERRAKRELGMQMPTAKDIRIIQE